MKLDELEIGDAGAGVIRERDAVAGRHRRVGRLAEHLTGAAGRQQRRRGRGPRARAPRRSKNATPRATPVLDDAAR